MTTLRDDLADLRRLIAVVQRSHRERSAAGADTAPTEHLLAKLWREHDTLARSLGDAAPTLRVVESHTTPEPLAAAIQQQPVVGAPQRGPDLFQRSALVRRQFSEVAAEQQLDVPQRDRVLAS